MPAKSQIKYKRSDYPEYQSFLCTPGGSFYMAESLFLAEYRGFSLKEKNFWHIINFTIEVV